MTRPIWKKVTWVEPGLYWFGGHSDQPITYGDGAVLFYRRKTLFPSPQWHAHIGPVPPEPKMPLPDLPMDAPILVRISDDGEWVCRHFKQWTDNGGVKCWPNGLTSWTAERQAIAAMFSQWKLPEGRK